MGITLTPKEVPPLGVLGDKPWPPGADTVKRARGRKSCGFASGGAGPPQVAIGRGGTPAKPGFLRSKKCAQIENRENRRENVLQ
jgi:hypothetical protein